MFILRDLKFDIETGLIVKNKGADRSTQMGLLICVIVVLGTKQAPHEAAHCDRIRTGAFYENQGFRGALKDLYPIEECFIALIGVKLLFDGIYWCGCNPSNSTQYSARFREYSVRKGMVRSIQHRRQIVRVFIKLSTHVYTQFLKFSVGQHHISRFFPRSLRSLGIKIMDDNLSCS